MVHVALDGDAVRFEVRGIHKLWAFKSGFRIPRRNIRRASRDASAFRGWKGWRALGTMVPGIITAGTYYHEGKRVFWDVRHPKKAVVVDLDGESYNRLIIEVEDPDAVVTLLSAGT